MALVNGGFTLRDSTIRRCAVAIVLLGGSLAGCFIPYGGDVQSPRWDSDGQHIYYLEQRFLTGPHPYEYHRLYRARPDLRESSRIASGEIYATPFEPLAPSPDGRWLLYQELRALIVYDVQRQSEVRRIAFPLGWPMAVGWIPGHDKFYFTDEQGIETRSVHGETSQLVVPGRVYGRNWSPSGRLLLYATGRGWPKGNELHVWDTLKNEDRVLSSKRSGLVSGAVFTEDEGKAVFAVSLIDGKDAGIYAVDISGSQERQIWRGTTSFLEGLKWARGADALVFATRKTGHAVTILALELGGQVHPILEDAKEWTFAWDYHRATHSLVVPNADRSRFVVIDLEPVLSAGAQP